MNLYKITFTHYAPKDSEQGIKALVLAENDEQVYNWIASEPTTKEGGMYNSWKERENYEWDVEAEAWMDEDGNDANVYWYDENGDLEDFKSRMLRLKGEDNDDEVELNDLYYGETLYGWELLKENTSADYSELIELGIVFNATTTEVSNE
jgi:hypothetical protein